jgi:hypothetical protein
MDDNSPHRLLRYASQFGPKADRIGESKWQCPLCAKLRPRADEISLILVFHEGVRAIAAAGGFRVPLALVILVLNGFRMARDFLLGGGRLRRGKRVSVGWKAFRKRAVAL